MSHIAVDCHVVVGDYKSVFIQSRAQVVRAYCLDLRILVKLDESARCAVAHHDFVSTKV